VLINLFEYEIGVIGKLLFNVELNIRLLAAGLMLVLWAWLWLSLLKTTFDVMLFTILAMGCLFSVLFCDRKFKKKKWVV